MDYLFTKSKNHYKGYNNYYINKVCKPFISLTAYLNSGFAGDLVYARYRSDGSLMKEDLIGNAIQCDKLPFLFFANHCYNKGFKKNVSVNQLRKERWFIHNQACIVFCLNAALNMYGSLDTELFRTSAWTYFFDCVLIVIDSYFNVFGSKEDKDAELMCLVGRYCYFKQIFTKEILISINNIAIAESIKNFQRYFKGRKTFAFYSNSLRHNKDLFTQIKNKHKVKTMKLADDVKERIVQLKTQFKQTKEIKEIVKQEFNIDISIPTIYGFIHTIKNGEIKQAKDQKAALIEEIAHLYETRKLKSYKEATCYYYEKIGKTISIPTIMKKIKAALNCN